MEYGAYTHQGIHRKSNEDHYYIPGQGGQETCFDMMIVADGMGGHNAGGLASRIAVEYVYSHIVEHKPQIQSSPDMMRVVNRAIQEANHRILGLSMTETRFSGMGTTLTMAVFEKDRFFVAHVGDSRCYLIRNGKARQITKDHSLVQELVDNGSITQDEMDIHPKKNVITRALGTDQRLRIDFFEEVLLEGDIVLLCTDGLTNYVNLQEYANSFTSNMTMEDLASMLGNEALNAGGSDDITITAVRYSGNRGER